MKNALVLLALGVFPAFGGSRIAPTRLYIHFQQDPPDAVLESIEEELTNIMVPAGMEFEWRSLKNTLGNEVSVELAVIHFKGTCDIADMAPVDGYPGPLGWTHMSDGEILPFSDINCDGIRIFVQRDLLRVPEANREAAFGRAIARVLAHELYHIFAKTTKHAAWGIGKPAYTVQELLSSKFQFEKKECDALRKHQAHLATMTGAAGQ
jgi:hypothetical protein